jgi:probable F420-dependent oxidoreductase
MANNLTFGLLTGATAPAEVHALEELDYDALWVGGHVASRNPSPEALMQLARLVALTTRVRVGTSVLLLPLYPPAIVAKQLADLDRVSGGRVTLGVGVGGEYPQEFDACGVPLGERGARTDEAIALMRRLWTSEEIAFEGRFHRMGPVRIHPPPVQPGGPPIVVAGRRSPAMRRAATLGDGWMPYLYSPERYAASVAEVRAHADAAGRRLAGFAWMAFVFVNVAERAADARADAAAFFGGTFRQDVDGFLDRVAAVGTAAQVAERLAAFVEAGARHLIIAPATSGDAARFARCVASEVRPLVESAFRSRAVPAPIAV